MVVTGFDPASGELRAEYTLPESVGEPLIAEFVGTYPDLGAGEFALPSRLISEFAKEFDLALDPGLDYFIGARRRS